MLISPRLLIRIARPLCAHDPIGSETGYGWGILLRRYRDFESVRATMPIENQTENKEPHDVQPEPDGARRSANTDRIRIAKGPL